MEVKDVRNITDKGGSFGMIRNIQRGHTLLVKRIQVINRKGYKNINIYLPMYKPLCLIERKI